MNTVLILCNETGGWLPFEQKEGEASPIVPAARKPDTVTGQVQQDSRSPFFFLFFHLSLEMLHILLKSFLVSIFVLF